MPSDEQRDLGNYFAGFIDGEGCFTLSVVMNKSRGVPYLRSQARFKIKVCIEDTQIIQKLQGELGTGDIYFTRDGEFVILSTSTLLDAKIISEYFSNYPLRAKKAKDFEIWQNGIDLIDAHKPNTSWTKKELEDFLVLREQINNGFHAHNHRSDKEIMRLFRGD